MDTLLIRYPKIFKTTMGGLIIALAWVLLAVCPIWGASAYIDLSTEEGEIGDTVTITGNFFPAGSFLSLYFSADEADIESNLDIDITTYKYLGLIHTDSTGRILEGAHFQIPDQMPDGKDEADVTSGKYYIYVTHKDGKEVIASAFIRIPSNAETEISPQSGPVDGRVDIESKDLRPGQQITVKYDNKKVALIGDDHQTDDEGRFHGAILIPESSSGKHTISVTDESGNEASADYTVKPKIVLSPDTQSVLGTVEIKGSGFNERKTITITLDGVQIQPLSQPLVTTYYGSFQASFIIPMRQDYTTGAIVKVQAYDTLISVEAELSIPAIKATIKLSPETTGNAAAHVGMELTLEGMWFSAGSQVSITLDKAETALVVTTTQANQSFTTRFKVPPCPSGEHTVTATDDDRNTATATFFMEEAAPPVPALPSPVATEMSREVPALEWPAVTDPSGVTYRLEVAEDEGFASIVLAKKGLTEPEYKLTVEEANTINKTGHFYYWRVKAVDGALNESEWSASGLFHIGQRQTNISAWVVYTWTGLGLFVVAIIILWLWRKHVRG